ncbi:hypothetical protein Vadar_025943 [Vaccinium darrowii]|uniref:Uncharacterized protein n=1 Tax=Vaccinium darrowii TaxID=229202 RepID=A0ACB7Z766_9ERIC|nr:hypothetical protein Vadar_025943 [Vaccinium darrowii]
MLPIVGSCIFSCDSLTLFLLLYCSIGVKIHDAIKVTSSDELQKVILLAFQVVKKSVKVRKMARHPVERCSIIAWLSSIVSIFCGKQYQALTNLSRGPLNTALEVVNDVISNRNIIEWLQQFSLEQLSELSTHLYKLLVGGNLIDENVHLVTSVLEILTSTLKISQERKVYQPHFTLSVEGLFKIYKVVNVCCDGIFSHCAELGLKAVPDKLPTIVDVELDSEVEALLRNSIRSLKERVGGGRALGDSNGNNWCAIICKTEGMIWRFKDQQLAYGVVIWCKEVKGYKLMKRQVLANYRRRHCELQASYTISSGWSFDKCPSTCSCSSVSEYLGMNQEVVIMHWACAKITASLAIPNASVLEILLDKVCIIFCSF